MRITQSSDGNIIKSCLINRIYGAKYISRGNSFIHVTLTGKKIRKTRAVQFNNRKKN